MSLELLPSKSSSAGARTRPPRAPIKINMPPLTVANPFPSPEITQTSSSKFNLSPEFPPGLSFSSSTNANVDFVPNIRSPRIIFPHHQAKKSKELRKTDCEDPSFYRACAEMIEEKFPTSNCTTSICSEEKWDIDFFDSEVARKRTDISDEKGKLKGISEERSISSSSSPSLTTSSFKDSLHDWLWLHQQGDQKNVKTNDMSTGWASWDFRESEEIKHMDEYVRTMFMDDTIRNHPIYFFDKDALEKTHCSSKIDEMKNAEKEKKKSIKKIGGIKDVLTKSSPRSTETTTTTTTTTTATKTTTTTSMDTNRATVTMKDSFFKDDSVSSFGSSIGFVSKDSSLDEEIHEEKHISTWEKIKKISPRLSPRISQKLSPRRHKKRKQKECHEEEEKKSFSTFSNVNEKRKKFRR